jgi:ABC-type dipeptide/oligopeptide/nickel transport system ATPase component
VTGGAANGPGVVGEVGAPPTRVQAGRVPLLSIESLSVGFEGASGPAVSALSLCVMPGQIVALVGESGSGKSVTALSLLGLLPESAWVRGRAIFRREGGEEIDLYGGDRGAGGSRGQRALRGTEISMIFQEPMTSLNPVFTIGEQLMEGLRMAGVPAREARGRAAKAMAEVGISEPERRLSQYPHEFSGGMRQRVMIAMALLRSPRLLIADEPTTALDVTVQAQVLDLLAGLRAERGLSILLITHDLGLVSRVADVAAVMFRGRLVEVGPVGEVFRAPSHPYTRALLACAPRVGMARARLMNIADILAQSGEERGGHWLPPADPQAGDWSECSLEVCGPGHWVGMARPEKSVRGG